MQLILDDKEAALLRHIVEVAVGETRDQVRHTRDSEDRVRVKSKERALVDILTKLTHQHTSP